MYQSTFTHNLASISYFYVTQRKSKSERYHSRSHSVRGKRVSMNLYDPNDTESSESNDTESTVDSEMHRTCFQGAHGPEYRVQFWNAEPRVQSQPFFIINQKGCFAKKCSIT